jgi:hypothetical protein
MSDTPTTNWCTLNPLDATLTLSNGNLDWSAPSSVERGARGTFAVSTGKRYFEYITKGQTFELVGWAAQAQDNNLTMPTGVGASTWAYYLFDLKTYNNATASAVYGTAASSGDTIMVALDLDNSKIYWGRNGTWFNSGDPATGTNAAYTNVSGTLFPWVQQYNQTSSINFGQRAFAYSPPTGFKALNTANQPAPSIADGSQYFNTVLYTGDGSTDHPITGVGFQPDFVWIKERNDNGSHQLYDAVRGATKRLESDNTTTETTITNGLKSFDTDGFSLGNYSNGNQLNITHASWNWLASNTSGSSNTDGSITSTVSSNLSAGFSIVTYTGDQSSTQTVGHGLGVAPSFIIVKDRDSSSRNWPCYHKDLGLDKVILLNSANAPQSITGYWGSSITSTVFGLPAGGYDNNPTGDKLIAYCWAEVEGYSKFGSYTGNGSTDGTFVYCGFRPAYVINKRTDSTNGWNLWDTTRNPYNTAGIYLQPYSSDSEYNDTTYMGIDMLSNGFKFRNSYSANNGSGSSYIFIAFAENPFGGSNVSPATAR